MSRKLSILILFVVIVTLTGPAPQSSLSVYSQGQEEKQLVPAFSPQSKGPSVENSYEILLRSRQFMPEVGLELPQSKAGAFSIEKERAHVLLQLYDIPRSEEIATLRSSGIELLNYIPHNAWFASLPAYGVASTLESSGVAELVRWAGEIHSEDKVPSDVWSGQFGSWAIAENGCVRLVVSFFDDVPLESGRAIISQHGGIVESEIAFSNELLILLQATEIPALAAEDEVRWLDQVPPPPVTHNDGSRDAVNVDAIQYTSYELTGQGVTIGMWDNGAVDWNHDDFKRPDNSTRVITRTDTITDHATHVAGTMAGNGSRSQAKGGAALQWRGMAPDADIISYDFSDPIDEYVEAIGTYGIDLSQNSWGNEIDAGNCEHYGDYRWVAPDFDKIVYEDRIPIIFSAGDERDKAHCLGYKPYGNIAPSGGTAKNTIVVGAINSDDQSMTDFSSWGPVDDGRLKPEVVAPGCESGGGYIKSTLPGNTYGGVDWCGTSMAAPVVSGISALLVEQYRQIYGTDPWPSTIKALLVHSAQDLDDPANDWYNPGPDYASGYGLVDAQAAATLVCEKAVRQETISGGREEFKIQVPADATQLTVTLAWDDPEAADNAASTLVNDLDLIVGPMSSGDTYGPWILDPSHPMSDAVQAQKDEKDGINNLEQVLVTDPTPGEWVIMVTGNPREPQEYSLVSEAFVDPIDAGLCYLRRTQEITGSWSSNVGVTSLAALAFLNDAYDESDPDVSEAIQYIVNHSQSDGSIHEDGSRKTYKTSLALITLKATRAYTDVRLAARDWLTASQWDDDCMWSTCPITEDNWYWGGFGYGNHTRPDMSNSQFALLALNAADLPESDMAWEKAITFVSRSQNRTASNDGFLPGDDGGFVYRYGSSTTSRGSMTGAGIWGLALAGLKPADDERLLAAFDWVEDYYSWDHHPLTDGSLGNSRLYYYYLSMSKALSMRGTDTIVTSDGKLHDWHKELTTTLVISQQQDGSWVNSNTEVMEGNPDLVTSYAILSWQTRVLPPDADLEMVIILHSPADLHLYDAKGHHTGKNYETGGIDEYIPGSSYSIIPSQTITITPPVAGNYHLELVGTGEGEWQIEIIGTWNDDRVSRDVYAGTITTGTVLATNLNVGAFVGPLTIFNLQPTEAPVMRATPGSLDLSGQPGETLHTSFKVMETTGSAAPIERISVVAPELKSKTGMTIPVIITPTAISSIGDDQTVELTIPLTADLPTGVYSGSIVVESVNSGAKSVQLSVRAFIPVGGHTLPWTSIPRIDQYLLKSLHIQKMSKPQGPTSPTNHGCDIFFSRNVYLPVRTRLCRR